MPPLHRLFLGLSLSIASIQFGLGDLPIRFRPEAHRAVVTGTLSQRVSSRTYRFRGRAHQRLGIDLESFGGTVAMYHIVFPGGATFGMKGYDPYPGMLTAGGTYRIFVEVNQMASNGTHGRFRLTLTR